MTGMTLGRIARLAVAAGAGAMLGLGVFLFVTSMVLSAGVQVPSGAYASLGGLLGVTPGSLTEIDEGMVPLPHGSPEEVRAAAFEFFNLPRRTRERLGGVPLKLGYSGSAVAGLYDAGLNTVFIRQPFLQVVMHEYAHVNFERKPHWEKTAFAIALLRLWFESDPRYERPRKALLASFEMAGRYANEGLPFFPVHEMYAVITEVTGGDLNALPGYLRPYYSDFLQPASPAEVDNGFMGK